MVDERPRPRRRHATAWPGSNPSRYAAGSVARRRPGRGDGARSGPAPARADPALTTGPGCRPAGTTPLRRLPPLRIPGPRSVRPGVSTVKWVVRLLTAWELDPVVNHVNRLQQTVTDALAGPGAGSAGRAGGDWARDAPRVPNLAPIRAECPESRVSGRPDSCRHWLERQDDAEHQEDARVRSPIRARPPVAGTRRGIVAVLVAVALAVPAVAATVAVRRAAGRSRPGADPGRRAVDPVRQPELPLAGLLPERWTERRVLLTGDR